MAVSPIARSDARPLSSEPSDIVRIASQVAQNVAGPAAASVDREGRFPTEGINALRDARLLSALIPRDFGGMGCSITELSEICQILGQHCANTAMVFAMHQIQVASIVRHSNGSEYFAKYMREIVDDQLVLASATSEVAVGGDVRSSVCAVERTDNSFSLRKQAPVISYGEQSDAILVTARRAADSPPSDQVMVLARKESTKLERTSDWDALGFRGTCSCGFILEAIGDHRQILPDAYDEISGRTMLPFSHILWSSLWLGIATDAVNRARAFIRDAARKKPGSVPPGATRLAELVAVLQMMRSGVEDAVNVYESIYDDADALSSISFALRMNNLKVQSSQLIVQIVAQALTICGISGYKVGGKYSVERHLRDAYGAGIMINNDRILGASASMLLVHRDE
ncbi:MAG TPA: acyl-CoA dehydrogenase family protein [Gemmatimonadaceae bacterium]